MRPILLVTLLVGLFLPSYCQQQLCFSKNCPQTPATIFALDRSNKQLAKVFRPSPVLPAYTPVAPLALSPSSRQFFQYSVPLDVGHDLGLVAPGNATAMVEARHDATIGTHPPADRNNSHIAGPTFSTRQGGIIFAPPSPVALQR